MAGEDAAQAETLASTLASIPGITQSMIDANSEWIDSMERATLVSDTQLREAISKLSLATGDLGAAQDLTTIAIDAAAGSGKELSTVTDALAKAVGGNMTSLQKLFPFLVANKEQLDTNRDGALSLDEAMKGLSDAYSGTAQAAANKKPWEQLQVVWEQIAEEIGAQLLPYLQQLAAWLTSPENQDAIKEIVDGFVKFTKAVADLTGKIAKILGPLGRIVDILMSINNWIQRILDLGNPFKHWNQPDVRSPGNSWGMPSGRSARSSRAVGATRAGGGYTAAPITVNVSGALDPEAVARQIRAILDAHAVRQGGAPARAMSW
jgi:hypothetical protein